MKKTAERNIEILKKIYRAVICGICCICFILLCVIKIPSISKNEILKEALYRIVFITNEKLEFDKIEMPEATFSPNKINECFKN